MQDPLCRRCSSSSWFRHLPVLEMWVFTLCGLLAGSPCAHPCPHRHPPHSARLHKSLIPRQTIVSWVFSTIMLLSLFCVHQVKSLDFYALGQIKMTWCSAVVVMSSREIIIGRVFPSPPTSCPPTPPLHLSSSLSQVFSIRTKQFLHLRHPIASPLTGCPKKTQWYSFLTLYSFLAVGRNGD